MIYTHTKKVKRTEANNLIENQPILKVPKPRRAFGLNDSVVLNSTNT